MVLLAACGAPDVQHQTTDEALRFQNVADTTVAFVGDAACATCHADLFASYERHGMANSFYRLTAANAVEDFTAPPVLDERQGLAYRMYRDGDRFFQEEYRVGPGGEVTHRLAREMQYVVGSGTAARTYLTEENGRLFQLPITWYTQGQRWDFSPGYEAQNVRFTRTIPDACMTCHNSYADAEPFTSKYTHVPEGIGCERCHGPGALHVEARLAQPEPADSIDDTIVNPAHLSLDRRLDVCQQCHLQSTVRLVREGREVQSFRPGQNLAVQLALFSVERPDEPGRISVDSHADRMQRSACFIESRAMDCTTCHDPHQSFRDLGATSFNTTCQTCHAPAALSAQFAGRADVLAQHAPSANCIACHMPKSATKEAPHTAFTDHWVRVVREAPAAAPPAQNADVTLVPYYAQDRETPEGRLYLGMAYVVFGRQNGDQRALRRGVTLLDEGLRGHDDAYSEAHYLLGYARLQLGEVGLAVPPLERAVALEGVPERLNTLAQAYEATGKAPAEIEPLYRRALALQPALADMRVNYGRFLEAQGRLAEAETQYRQAATEQPSLAAAQYNLGTAALRLGRPAEAEQALVQAVTLTPDDAQARGNLGLLYATTGRTQDAGRQFEAAVAASPTNVAALGNLGAFYLNQGQAAKAQPLLERSVELNPAYVDGLVNLAVLHVQAGRAAQAAEYATRALSLNPAEPRARQVLDLLRQGTR